ncbi:MAG: hypothetical protein PHV68_05905 [Candidatus Gastranaerophilales bacterium]|nr:hypothetical protein [Candidatus Gastranaerophilales bacterium]
MKITSLINNIKPQAGKLLEKAGDFASKIPEKTVDRFDFKGVNPSLAVSSLICYGFVLFPRLAKADSRANHVAKKTGQPKKSDEVKEILLRDAVTITTILYAFPLMQKLSSAFIEKRTGFVLSQRPRNDVPFAKKVIGFLNPFDEKTHKNLPLDELEKIYGNINSKNTILPFCDYIDKNNGSLGKIFSHLNKDDKNLLTRMLSENNGGKDIELNKATNKQIKEVLEIAFGDKSNLSESACNLFTVGKEKLAKALSMTANHQGLVDAGKKVKKTAIRAQNNLIQNAKAYNSVFGFLSIILIIPGFLGFMLPNINEDKTKARYKDPIDKFDKNPTNSVNSNNVNFENSKKINQGKEKAFDRFLKK